MRQAQRMASDASNAAYPLGISRGQPRPRVVRAELIRPCLQRETHLPWTSAP